MPENRTRSLRALDALNFCNAGVQTGLGPFMAIFYTAARHWSPGEIGVLLACQSLAGIAVQSFTGKMIDESHHKKTFTALAASVVALAAIGIGLLPQYPIQIGLQLIIGVAVTVFPAATGAFALGMSGENELTTRVARNESFTHFGNASFAVIAAVAGFVKLAGIFYAAAFFASGMVGSVMFIKSDDVSHEKARQGIDEKGEEKQPKGFRELFKDQRILIFTVAVVLFNISNAATLPLVGEILSKNNHGSSSAWQVAAAVFIAELVMIFVAKYTGGKADSWGRKPLFLVAFAVLALRNGLTIVSHKPLYLISLQAMDGVAAAIYGVLLTLVVADLGKGTGRFNFLQGSVQSAMGLGGFLSNLAFGFIAGAAGFNVSFMGLSIAAITGGLLYQFRMPETKTS